MMVCFCHAINDKTIRQAVREGCARVKDVQKRCAAGTSCGGCLPHVQEVVNAAKEQAHQDDRQD